MIACIGLVLASAKQVLAHAHEPSGQLLPIANQLFALDNQSTDPWRIPGLYVPPMLSFNSQRLDEQLQNYSAYLAIWGTPDVLIVGSSRSLQGIDPVALQQTLAMQGLPDLKIYNFSINGATAQVVDLVVRHLLHNNQTPRFILWADGSRAFNSSRNDLTYQNIRASAGFQQTLVHGPPIPNWQTAVIQESTSQLCRDFQSRSVPLHRSRFLGIDQQWQSPLAAELPITTSACATWRHNSSLARFDPRVSESVTQSLRYLIEERPSNTIDVNGFLAVEARFNPTAYYQQHPRVRGQYDADYAQFKLEGEQTDAAIALAQFAAAQDKMLMFVNLPLSTDYLDTMRRQREEQFHQHLQTLAAQAGFAFHNLNQAELQQNAFFADPSHLNRDGARAVSQRLGTDPVFLRWLAPLNH